MCELLIWNKECLHGIGFLKGPWLSNDSSEFSVLILFDLSVAFSLVALSFLLEALFPLASRILRLGFPPISLAIPTQSSFTVSFSFLFPNIRMTLGSALEFFSLLLSVLSLLVISSRLIFLNVFLYTDNSQIFVFSLRLLPWTPNLYTHLPLLLFHLVV